MLCICFLIFVLFFSEERAYTSDDVLIICGKYNDFLKALASRTNRVSKAMVVLAAKKVFKGESEKAICDFAAAMATCLSHCFRAADKASTGERLQPEVRDIILKFKHPKLLELQCKLRGITEGTVAIEEDDSQKVAIEEKKTDANLPSPSAFGLPMNLARAGTIDLEGNSQQPQSRSPQAGNEDDIMKLYGLSQRRSLKAESSCVSVQSSVHVSSDCEAQEFQV